MGSLRRPAQGQDLYPRRLRSITATTRFRPPTFASDWSRWSGRRRRSRSGSRTRHLGRAEATGRNRLPGKVCRGKAPASVLPRLAGGPVTPPATTAVGPLREHLGPATMHVAAAAPRRPVPGRNKRRPQRLVPRVARSDLLHRKRGEILPRSYRIRDQTWIS